jgi:REP element-mobilizing transposase RayT
VQKHDYIEFQERTVARGYLITFRCYGTWLHGDERGSVDRRFYNRPGTSKIAPDIEKETRRATQLRGEPCVLDANKRRVVETAIREVCGVREYVLYAINVRTNHVHVVVGNSGKPERMMDSFKAYATKALRAAGMVGSGERVWSRHGSTRYLWTEEHIATAVEYATFGQGDEMPKFE